MRTLLSGELAQAQREDSDIYIKLEVQNGSGTWIDVGAALGSHWIVNATFSEGIDTPMAQATFTLVQKIGVNSLAPLMSTSVLNVDDAMAYAPQLDIGRLARASSATMARGVTLDVSKYRLVFTGRIDDVNEVDSAESLGPITLTCSDLGGWLMDMQIETDGRTYGSTIGVPLEDVMQAVINDNLPVGEPSVTLVKESSSSFAVTDTPPYKQGTAKVLEALTALALDSTGEDVRYRFDAAHVSQLTWFNPDRTRVTVDATYGPDQYVLSTLGVSLANVRNVVRMPFTDAATSTSGYVTGTNLGSIDKYRRRFNGMPGSSLLTTEAQAQTVVDVVASDLGDAPANASGLIPFAWFVQLYDRYTFQANNRQYDQDQTLAVVGYQHVIENGRGSTTLTLAGRIVGAYAAWLKRISSGGIVEQSLSILRISSTESADGTMRNFVLTVGTRVDSLHVHYRTVAIDLVTTDDTDDAHNFSETSVLPVDAGSPLIVRTVGRLVTFSLPQPSRDDLLAARFVPYGGIVEGPSVPFTVDAAPPAINAVIHATKVGALANLSIDIAFGISDGPVSVAVIERLLGVPTTLLTLPMDASDTIDWTVYPELADRHIPANADSLSWTVEITDVAGEVWIFGPTVALPSVVNVKATPSETAGVGTVTVVVTDSGSYLDPTHLDGAVTSQISWHVTNLGVTTVLASTTHVGSGTNGIYTLVQTLDPLHPILVSGFLHYVDGSTESFGSWTFDSDKIADVVNATVATVSGVATVTVVWDTDALVGANCLKYTIDGGAPVTSVTISAGYLSTFSITQTSAKQLVVVSAKNAVDGGATYGNQTTIEIDAYAPSNSQGTVSIAPDGNWTAVIDGPSDALSFKWSSSTSAFPADATVASSGTLVTGTGRLLSISGGPLTAGQVVFITAIPFSAVSAGGTTLPSIHVKSIAFAPGSSQGTVSIDSNGNWAAIADGPANTLSFRWSSDTSSYPADATVTSSGTLVTGTGRLLSMSGGPLAFGQTVFITIVPFSATSGSGTALPTIHIQGSYLTYTASKTQNFSASGWTVAFPGSLGIDWDINHNATIPTSGVGAGWLVDLFAIVPAGVTITSVAVEALWKVAGTPPTAFSISINRRTGTTFTSLGSVTPAQTASFVVATISALSETVSAGRSYVIMANTSQIGSGPTSGDAAVGDIAVTYSMPDPKQTL